MPENLFISYARADGLDHAQQLNTDLLAHGHEVWFDKDDQQPITPGSAWMREIEAGIDDCTVFLLLMTPKSIVSSNCEAEWTRALNKKKTIIPLLMKPTDGATPVEFDQLPLYIAPLQYIDFANDFDAGWRALTHRLTQLSDETFQAEQSRAQQTHRMIPAAASGYLLTDPDDVPRLPDTLIGRDDLKAQVESHLANNDVVTLHGIGGIGKSSLAADIIADQLEHDPSPVLWLEVGNASHEQVFTKVGEVFNQQKEMLAAATEDAKIRLTRDLLRQHNIKTVVIDDAWNPSALSSLINCLPKRNRLPVIVTSRQIQRHITGGNMLSVEALAPDDAKTLLNHHMGTGDTGGADDLCEAVYYHPFLLEVAGKLLAQRGIPPGRLLDEMDNIMDVALPDGVAEAGRKNMAKLLQQSLDALPDDLTRNVFMAFGHLPTTITTPELLSLLLRDDLDDMNQYGYDHRFDENPAPLHDLPDLPAIQKALETLFTHGLVKRLPAEQQGGYPYTIERFRLHDLAHSYATARTHDPDRMVTACLVLTWRHNQPTHDNFAALRSDLDNLMGASATAMTLKRWGDAERFVQNMYEINGSQFLRYHSYYSDTATLLLQATDAANHRGDKQAQGAHLSNLGNAYFSLGQYDMAIDYYQQQIGIANEIDDKKSKGNALGTLSLAYDSLGQYDMTIDYYHQQIGIANETNDKKSKGNALGNLGITHDLLGQYNTAIDCQKQRLAICEEIGDIQGKGQALGNLGIAYGSLGQYNTAIDCQKQRLAICEEIGDIQGKGQALGNLGLVYDLLGQYETAIDCQKQRLAICEEIGDIQSKGQALGNLGVVYQNLGQRNKAIINCEQALSIRRSIGDRNGIAIDAYNLGLLYNNMGRYADAIPLLEESVTLAKETRQSQYLAQHERQLARARKCRNSYLERMLDRLIQMVVNLARQLRARRGDAES